MATMKVQPEFMAVWLDLSGIVCDIIRCSFHAVNDEVEEIRVCKSACRRRPP